VSEASAPLPAADLRHVLDHTRDLWEDYRGARLFLTGVTGFVGSWLLETLVYAETTLSLGLRTTVLVRDRAAFESRLPHLAHSPLVRVQVGDVRVADPPTQAFSHIVHCASASPPQLNDERPGEVEDIIARGSERMVEEAESGNGVRLLQMGSGSVYGPQPPSVERIGEAYAGEADASAPAQRFGAAKRRAERRGEASVARGVGFVSVRAFALVGPRLPLNGQFAIGNFLGDALAGRPIALTGDGSPVRSWMHAADLAAWCWTLLARGEPGHAYNAGSEEALSLWDAAQHIAALHEPPLPVSRVAPPEPSRAPSRYVPSIARARDELGLDAWIPFDDAIRRTWDWLRTNPA
jgi:dTDP-glucose 4,6-dehydratase